MICTKLLKSVIINVDYPIDDAMYVATGVIRLRGGRIDFRQNTISRYLTGINKPRAFTTFRKFTRTFIPLKTAATIGEQLFTKSDPGPNSDAKKTDIPTTLCKVKVGGMSKKKLKNVLSMVRSMKEGSIYFTLNWYVSSVNCPTTTLTPGTNNVIPTTANWWWKPDRGIGPPLYSETFVGDTIAQGTFNPYWTYGCVSSEYYVNGGLSATYDGSLMTWNQAGALLNSNVLNFSSNYPFQTMLPFSTTQTSVLRENWQVWKEDNTVPTTDPFYPIPYSVAVGNKDWTKLVIMGTQYKMTFTNYNPWEQMVEVLFYKVIPDIDALSGVGELSLLVTNQSVFVDDYYRRGQTKFGIPQYAVVQRDRFRLPAQTNPDPNGNQAWFIPNQARHVVERTYTVKQKYSVERPVKAGGVTPTETTFFNTYIDHQAGIYCRISSWQTDGCLAMQTWQLNASGNVTIGRTQQQVNAHMPYSYSINVDAGTTNPTLGIPTGTISTNGTIRPFTNCLIQKKCWIYMDSVMLKGPLLT